VLRNTVVLGLDEDNDAMLYAMHVDAGDSKGEGELKHVLTDKTP
jgi:hypothetical protein